MDPHAGTPGPAGDTPAGARPRHHAGGARARPRQPRPPRRRHRVPLLAADPGRGGRRQVAVAPHQTSSAFVWIAAGIALLFVTVGRMPVSRLWAAIALLRGREHRLARAAPGRAERRRRPRGARGHDGRARRRQGGEPRDRLPRRPGPGDARRLRDRPAPRVDRRGGRGGHRRLRLLGRDRDQGAGGLAGREPRQRLPGRRSRTRRGRCPGATKRLVVTGIAIMGGVEVKN